VWNQFLTRIGLRPPPEPAPRESVEDLLAKTPELRELLESLGLDSNRDQAVSRLMSELKLSIRAAIADYSAFRSALARAEIRRRSMPDDKSFALLDLLRDAPDEAATLAILNSDPIHSQVPFIEQIPVPRNGELTWVSPVDHSLIRRRPDDAERFKQAVAELEGLFSAPHRARLEPSRLAVLDAIVRLQRELERGRSYLPTPILFLETKLEEYRTKSLKRGAAEALEAVLATVGTLADLRNSAGTTNDSKEQALQLSALASHYLDTPGIQIPWLTSGILGLFLHPALTGAPGKIVKPRHLVTMDLIRREIQNGFYDPEETAQRLRRMEALGFHVSSLVYPLLRLHGSTGRTAGGDTASNGMAGSK